jgi:hypothetical protein
MVFVFWWFKQNKCWFFPILFLLKYIANLTSENKIVFKSKENKGNLTENHAKIKKYFCFFWWKNYQNPFRNDFTIIILKNVVLFEIYSVKSRVTNTYVHWLYNVYMYAFPCMYFLTRVHSYRYIPPPHT